MSVGPAEGGLHIDISLSAGDIAGVAVHNQRALDATRVLLGCPAGEAARRISRLFAVCRIAQGLCAAEALERAAATEAGAAQGLARRFLLLGETVLEHGSRAAFDWPALMGEAPRLEVVRRLRGALADLHRALYPDGDWMRPAGGRLAPDHAGIGERLGKATEALEEGVFSGVTPAARIAGWLRAEGLAGLGASEVAALPELPLAELDDRLSADRDGAFIARPDWLGAARHTGPLARRAGHPLVAAVVAEHGAGVLAHFTARLAELALCLEEMQGISAMLADDAGGAAGGGEGHGLGMVEAARGRLVHRVELEEGMVTRYQILAPTEWNFHPDGALPRGLAGQPAGGDGALRARLLIAALDPCVAYSLRVS